MHNVKISVLARSLIKKRSRSIDPSQNHNRMERISKKGEKEEYIGRIVHDSIKYNACVQKEQIAALRLHHLPFLHASAWSERGPTTVPILTDDSSGQLLYLPIAFAFTISKGFLSFPIVFFRSGTNACIHSFLSTVLNSNIASCFSNLVMQAHHKLIYHLIYFTPKPNPFKPLIFRQASCISIIVHSSRNSSDPTSCFLGREID